MFKKRKLISIMLTVSMMLTLFPFAAFAEEENAVTVTKSDATTAGYADLASAVSAADDGSIITGELSSQVQHLRMIQLKWCPVT